MRALILTGVSVALSLGLATPSEAACEPVGEIRFICDVIGPEDLAIVPGAQWVIASGSQEGGRLHLVSVVAAHAVPLQQRLNLPLKGPPIRRIRFRDRRLLAKRR